MPVRSIFLQLAAVDAVWVLQHPFSLPELPVQKAQPVAQISAGAVSLAAHPHQHLLGGGNPPVEASEDMFRRSTPERTTTQNTLPQLTHSTWDQPFQAAAQGVAAVHRHRGPQADGQKAQAKVTLLCRTPDLEVRRSNVLTYPHLYKQQSKRIV